MIRITLLGLALSSCFAPLLAAEPLISEPAPVCQSAVWQCVDCQGRPHARHEAAFVECLGRFHLLGGRRIQPVDTYDPATNTWTMGRPPPVEIHHFQPVAWRGRILLVGAMTGAFPREQALPVVHIYDPTIDAWSTGPEIPADRRRGGAGVVIHDDMLYLVCGIINGHWDGNVPWLDALDLRTGQWHRLPDAPRARDHFQTAIVDGRLYAVGGRRTSASTKQVFELTIPEVDVYDLATAQWRTLPPSAHLPKPRAGSMTVARDADVIVAGGESMLQKKAHAEVDALDTRSMVWRSLPPFVQGRHGGGLILFNNILWTAAGSGSRGGNPELDSMERLPLAVKTP